MKKIQEITKQELGALKVVTFDIDGVIAQTGTKIKEEDNGTKLYMESKPLSQEFIDNLKKLKKYIRFNFSSGRNILYLKSLVNQFIDQETILTAENGNLLWLNYQLKHPQYDDEYFSYLRDLKKEIRQLKKKDNRIRGFEPKFFILTVHSEEMNEIPELVKKIAGDKLYCLWTNEGYDIGSKKMSKGVAIQNLAQELSIQPKQIMTTGNNYNDQEMLKIGKGVSVNSDKVKGEYYIESESGKLGGEKLAEFLLEYYQAK